MFTSIAPEETIKLEILDCSAAEGGMLDAQIIFQKIINLLYKRGIIK